MADKIKPLIVTLDTNVFDGANYSYDDQDLSILKQYIEDGVIERLIISDIVVRECKRHLSEGTETLVEEFHDKFDSLSWKRVSSIGKLSAVPSYIDKEKITKGLHKLYDDYLKATHAQIVNSDGVNLESVISDYFNYVPPFKGGKIGKDKKRDHKKYEFPDAIIIARLKQIANECGELCVVSSDPDWQAAFWNYSGVKFYKDLKELFSSITVEQKVSAKAIKYFNSDVVKFNNRIENMLMVKPVNVRGNSYDRDGIETGIEYDDFDILNIGISSKIHNVDYAGETEAIMTIAVRANIEVECSFFDEDNSTWDYEEREYFYRAVGLAREMHEIKFPVTVTFKVKDGQISEWIKTDAKLPRKLVLDEETLLNRRFIDTDGFYSYKKTIQGECGHKIIVDVMEFVETSMPIDERDMGVETQHDIVCETECPNCGRIYQITGSIYEYPEGAFNYDQTEIKQLDTEENK